MHPNGQNLLGIACIAFRCDVQTPSPNENMIVLQATWGWNTQVLQPAGGKAHQTTSVIGRQATFTYGFPNIGVGDEWKL